MARELGTLGVRCLPAVHRFIAERTVQYIDVEIAGNHRNLPVKIGWLHGEVYSLKAEYDPAQEWARESGCPCSKFSELLKTLPGNLLQKPVLDRVPDENRPAEQREFRHGSTTRRRA